MRFDHVRPRVEMVIPDIVEQHRAGDHLPGVAHEIFQQPEFPRLQRDLIARPLDDSLEQIEFEIGDCARGP